MQKAESVLPTPLNEWGQRRNLERPSQETAFPCLNVKLLHRAVSWHLLNALGATFLSESKLSNSVILGELSLSLSIREMWVTPLGSLQPTLCTEPWRPIVGHHDLKSALHWPDREAMLAYWLVTCVGQVQHGCHTNCCSGVLLQGHNRPYPYQGQDCQWLLSQGQNLTGDI